MKTRLASVAAAALALSLAAPLAASAQTYRAPVVGGVTAAEAGPNRQPGEAVGYGWRSDRFDSSAKGGNAAQPERFVPQYGNTSGGPAY